MSATHLHLLLNHFPILGTLIGCILLIAGIWRKTQILQNAGAMTIFLMSLIAIPVFLTGDPAEETVENLPGVSERFMHEHEEAAEFAFWLLLFTGLIALVALLWKSMKPVRRGYLFWVVTGFAVVTFTAMARAGYYGGQIRHSEIRSGAVTGENAGGESGSGENEEEENNPARIKQGTDSLTGKTAADSAAVKANGTLKGKEENEEEEEKGKDSD